MVRVALDLVQYFVRPVVIANSVWCAWETAGGAGQLRAARAAAEPHDAQAARVPRGRGAPELDGGRASAVRGPAGSERPPSLAGADVRHAAAAAAGPADAPDPGRPGP